MGALGKDSQNVVRTWKVALIGQDLDTVRYHVDDLSIFSITNFAMNHYSTFGGGSHLVRWDAMTEVTADTGTSEGVVDVEVSVVAMHVEGFQPSLD